MAISEQQYITISAPERVALCEQRAHRRERVGCDGGDGCAAFSDLQAEELPLLQAQVVAHLVQENHTFILLLKDGNDKQTLCGPAKTFPTADYLLF